MLLKTVKDGVGVVMTKAPPSDNGNVSLETWQALRDRVLLTQEMLKQLHKERQEGSSITTE